MEKDLIEFFIYLRDECYNRDFNMEPKRVVECFRYYQSEGYKLPIDNVRICCNVDCNDETIGKSPYCEFHANM